VYRYSKWDKALRREASIALILVLTFSYIEIVVVTIRGRDYQKKNANDKIIVPIRRSYTTTVIRLICTNVRKIPGGLLADQIVLLSVVAISIEHYFNS
jgi:hypothetical protein